MDNVVNRRLKMLLGVHTYSLHLHGFGPTDICGTTAPAKAMDVFELMDYAIDIGVDGLHITPSIYQPL